jgi:hypothetical protein
MLEFMFSKRRLQKKFVWNVTPCRPEQFIYDSKEYTASIFTARVNQASSQLFIAYFLLGLLFANVDRGSIFLRNARELPAGYYKIILEKI